MNNKLLKIIIFLSFYSWSLCGQEYSIFNFRKTSNIDFITGKSLSQMLNNEDLYDFNIIENVLITRKSGNKISNTTYYYSNGKVLQIKSESKDGRDSRYKYNENGYLETVDSLRREYPQKNICLQYENDKIINKITLQNIDGGKKVIIEKPNTNDSNFHITHEYEYHYTQDKLISYIEVAYDIKGNIYSRQFHEFIYDNQNLVIHNVKINDELRWCYKLFYNQQNHLEKVVYTDLKLNFERKKYFECYDIHDNWTNSKEYYNNELICEIIRIIKYKIE